MQRKLWFIFIIIITFFMAKLCFAETSKDLPGCIQIYFKNALFPGTTANCKQVLDSVIKDNDHYLQAIILANGFTGEKPDPQKALAILKQPFDNMYSPDELANLINALQQRIANPALSTPAIRFCDLATSGASTGICAENNYQDKKHATELNLAKQAKLLKPPQAAALANLYTAFKSFNEADDEAQYSVGAFQGTGNVSQSFDSKLAKLKNFDKLITQLLTKPHYFLEKHAELNYRLVDGNLNEAYQKLLALKAKPRDSAFVDSRTKALIQAQREWLTFVNKFAAFTVTICMDALNNSKAIVVKENILALLTQSRLAAIKSFIDILSALN